MPIVSPPRLSAAVIEKVLRSVVTPLDDGWCVWDPKTDSKHIFKQACDCTGYRLRGSCSHVIAVEMYKKRRQGYSPEQVEELLRKL